LLANEEAKVPRLAAGPAIVAAGKATASFEEKMAAAAAAKAK